MTTHAPTVPCGRCVCPAYVGRAGIHCACLPRLSAAARPGRHRPRTTLPPAAEADRTQLPEGARRQRSGGRGLMTCQPCGRFEWERILRRAVMPLRVKFLAFVLASYADADGSNVRPGV